MELCSGDSTPTSVKSFQLSNVPTQRHNSSTPQSQVFIQTENSVLSMELNYLFFFFHYNIISLFGCL
jgi:hypothetical protein